MTKPESFLKDISSQLLVYMIYPNYKITHHMVDM